MREGTGSDHYRGDSGERYFKWQRVNGDINGQINARKFRKFISAEDCVLDFGAGTGFMLAQIRSRRRIAIELSAAAREACKENGLETFESLNCVEDSSVDVLISNHVLEHVPEPIQTLTLMRDKLKVGGILALVLPIDDWRRQQYVDPDDINHHLYTWTPLLLGHCLTEAGFDSRGAYVKVLTHAWFPGYAPFFRHAPEWLFDCLCTAFSALVKRREMIAVVKKS
jgi:SAM-dependent methyltransferase